MIILNYTFSFKIAYDSMSIIHNMHLCAAGWRSYDSGGRPQPLADRSRRRRTSRDATHAHSRASAATLARRTVSAGNAREARRELLIRHARRARRALRRESGGRARRARARRPQTRPPQRVARTRPPLGASARPPAPQTGSSRAGTTERHNETAGRLEIHSVSGRRSPLTPERVFFSCSSLSPHCIILYDMIQNNL